MTLAGCFSYSWVRSAFIDHVVGRRDDIAERTDVAQVVAEPAKGLDLRHDDSWNERRQRSHDDTRNERRQRKKSFGCYAEAREVCQSGRASAGPVSTGSSPA